MSTTKWIERQTVHNHISSLPGVIVVEAWGETSYFYNPGRVLPRGTYFATIKDHDGANDRASDLNRPGVWRLNMGVSKAAYCDRFGPPPTRPAKGGVIDGNWRFATRDLLTPHPVYGWMRWVAVISPSERTWLDDCIGLLADAHGRARAAFEKRIGRQRKK